MNFKWLFLGLLFGLVPGSVMGGTVLRQAFTGNILPQASFTFSPNDVHLGDVVTFDATTSRDPDGLIAEYSWDFGDGGKATAVQAAHSYQATGTFTVVLTVTDSGGKVDAMSVSLKVTTALLPILTGEFVVRVESALFGLHLTPQSPVRVTVIMVNGDLSQGVDFFMDSPTQIGFKSEHLDSLRVQVTFDLNSSTPGFVEGDYGIEIVNNAAVKATVSLTIVRIP